MNASPDSLLSDNFPESRPGAVTHELSRCLIPPKQNKRFTCISIFPWSLSSSATLWAGKFSGTGQEVRWRAMAKEWIDVGVIGCHGGIVIANVGPRKLSRRNIILDKDVEDIPVDAVAWALRESHPFSPLALFACNKCLYIVDAIAGEIVSVLRGHGGEIKSISVHPTSPHLVCTTSRDFSSRIYDLHKTPSEGIRGNLPWSSTPSLDPLASLEGIESLGGAPHGIHPTEPEGYSPGDSEPFGRCVLVLVGGRCGGHYDAVVHASFHPTLPLIATCGFDRAVKIWQLRLPKMDSSMTLLREDRPLFTTSQLHEAGVLSIFWTSDDTLLTHCMPMDHAGYERDPKPGSIIMWTWLGKNRFFPGGQPQSEERMRGVASDYLESSSFLILSQTPLPQSILSPKGRVNLYSHRTLGPIILMPSGRYIRMIKASELPIFDHSYRIEGPGVDDDAADAITEGLSNIRVDGELELGSRTDSIRGSQESPVLWTAAAGMTGSIIVALDVEGRVYVWHRRAPP